MYMRFSDKMKYKYLQENYGRKRRKKKTLGIVKSLDGMENYLEKKLGKYRSSK